jgi:hypothetical protein
MMIQLTLIIVLRKKRKGGGGTPWHVDGDGTVDSEHTNLHGYNEVVILRRLREDYRKDAMKLCDSLSLTTLPHNRDEESKWPTYSVIEKLRERK